MSTESLKTEPLHEESLETGASSMSSADHDNDPGHGNSPAAWTAVIIMLVAFAIGTLAFWFDIAWLVFVSAGFVVVGALVGFVLGKLGYGVGGAKVQPKAHG